MRNDKNIRTAKGKMFDIQYSNGRFQYNRI